MRDLASICGPYPGHIDESRNFSWYPFRGRADRAYYARSLANAKRRPRATASELAELWEAFEKAEKALDEARPF